MPTDTAKFRDMYNPITHKEACEAADEINRLRAEVAAERDDNEQRKEILANVTSSHDAWMGRAKKAEVEAAAARAMAFEEAARLCESWSQVSDGRERLEVAIRALAPLPASLVAVPREVLDLVKSALESGSSLLATSALIALKEKS